MCRMYSPVVNFNAPLNTNLFDLNSFYLSSPTVGPYWLRFGAQTSQSALEKKTLGRDDDMSQVLTTATLDLAILKRNKRPAGKLITISQAYRPNRLHFGHQTSLMLGFWMIFHCMGILEIGVGKIGEAFRRWMMSSSRAQLKFSRVTCCTYLLKFSFHHDISWAKATHKTFWSMNPNGCIHESVPDIPRCSFDIVSHVVRTS